jgi:signal transduction histidine kinase
MIKRLKRKYILIVMIAVTLVLGIIITAINITSYSSLNSQLYDKLTLIVENEGKMPDFPLPDTSEDDQEDTEKGDESDTEADQDEVTDGTETEGSEDGSDGNDKKGEKEEKEEEKKEDVRDSMSPETPFETRYFTVKFDTGGAVLAVDTTKIAAVDTERAEQYARQMYSQDNDSGYLESYKYLRGVTEDGSIIYVFLDATRELKSVRSFLVSSLFISGLGIVLIFIIVLLLSDFALRPIIESYEKQKRFITDAGHEMKTPLTVISANAEIIEMENGESQWTEGIRSQVAKLASLTEKLVILSKMEEGVKLEMNEFSVSEAFFDTCEQYRSIAMSKGVSFELAISENVRMVGNEGELRRCITLLADNAFRYVDEGGSVSVRVQKLTNGVEIRFSNTTSGIEKGSLDRWFDRFYRTDLSRNSDTGGSGIGLSVVQAIVHAHGGTVRAHSDDGITAEFIINI